MKNILNTVGKSFLSAIVFSVTVGVIVVYAANINSITSSTISNGDTIGAGWYTAVNNGVVPAGAVMAFNLGSCPTGRTAVANAVGRTIIGVGNGAGSNTSLGTIGGEKSSPAISIYANLPTSVTGIVNLAVNSIGGSNYPTDGASLAKPTSTSINIYTSGPTSGSLGIGGPQTFTGSTSGTISGGGTAPDNMQPYIAFLYCQKN